MAAGGGGDGRGVAAVSAWSQRLLRRVAPETGSAPAVRTPVVTTDGGPVGAMVRLAVAIDDDPVVAGAPLAAVPDDGPVLGIAALAVGDGGRWSRDWLSELAWSRPRR